MDSNNIIIWITASLFMEVASRNKRGGVLPLDEKSLGCASKRRRRAMGDKSTSAIMGSVVAKPGLNPL